VSVAAPSQPSTCDGERAPTIAPVTPGQVSVQAMATDDTVVLCRFAIGISALRSAMFLSGTYGQLLDYVVFGDWIFFGMIVATVFSYRRRDAAGARVVYRAPGYPVLPALFDIVAAFVVVSVIWSNPRNAALGAVLMALGVPAFLFWRRQSRQPAAAILE
jgi:L-asparagine transporter-like permease